jgi:hypothetical protein
VLHRHHPRRALMLRHTHEAMRHTWRALLARRELPLRPMLHPPRCARAGRLAIGTQPSSKALRNAPARRLVVAVRGAQCQGVEVGGACCPQYGTRMGLAPWRVVACSSPHCCVGAVESTPRTLLHAPPSPQGGVPRIVQARCLHDRCGSATCRGVEPHDCGLPCGGVA